MATKTKQDKDALFKGKFVKKYELTTSAIPHHDEFQRTVGKFVNILVAHPAKKASAGVVIAECGLGTGLTLDMIHAETDGFKGIKCLYAVDRSPGMVLSCTKRFSSPKVNFVTAEFGVFLKAHSAPLDCVYTAYAIHNLPKKAQIAMFKGIYRKLRPGGYLVDGDIFAHQDAAMQRMMFESQLESFRQKLPAGLAAQWIDHMRKDSLRYFVLDDLLLILGDIGFQVSIVYRNWLDAVIVAKKQEER